MLCGMSTVAICCGEITSLTSYVSHRTMAVRDKISVITISTSAPGIASVRLSAIIYSFLFISLAICKTCLSSYASILL